MNFLLLAADELGADGTAVLRGRRAAHVRTVLKAEPGRTLRAGVLGGALGTAVVTAVDAERVEVRVDLAAPPPPARDVLLLAVPRPKVLLRMLAHAAALGFGEIVLFRSWRVDKTWLASRALDAGEQRPHLIAGLEQAGRTQLPTVRRYGRFRPFVEDELPALGLPARRFVAHPTAAEPTARLAALPRQPFALALGPEGGFLPYEVDRLVAAGFAAIACGGHPLRTETALAALWGQLDLLRRMQ